MNKRDELANSEAIIRDTYIDSAFTAKNAFKKGWDSALKNAPEILELVKFINEAAYYDKESADKAESVLAAFDARGKGE